ncbi:hypothetical protein OU5_1892 [Pseudomonas mandelii JR-1]|uniref:Uncharacterized protein n=1 Tax=Pseudomonas mandelii JR-1 TaxID=1147786 RepID=A0A024E8K8_9PSED|nr:hypothetical protein OU5_1892 [Pseudomonas mandelii JR-1]
MGYLAAEDRNQQQPNETDDQLVKEGQRDRGFRQSRGTHHHRGRAPGCPGQYAQRIAHQHAVVEVVPGHAASKRDGDPDEGEENPQPLHRPQTFARQQPVHAQRGKNRRGVKEHRHMRCRGQLQTFGNEKELQTKQRTGQQATAPGAADLVPATLPADQQSYKQRGNTRPPRRLHDRSDVGRRPFDHHLLHAPDQAQPDHHLQGKPIGATPAGAHRNTSTTTNMAVTRQ